MLQLAIPIPLHFRLFFGATRITWTGEKEMSAEKEKYYSNSSFVRVFFFPSRIHCPSYSLILPPSLVLLVAITHFPIVKVPNKKTASFRHRPTFTFTMYPFIPHVCVQRCSVLFYAQTWHFFFVCLCTDLTSRTNC